MSDVCGDNRFEIIEAYKKKLIEDTNIESRPDEMAVIDNILLRFWQMGWLPCTQPEQQNTRIFQRIIVEYPPSIFLEYEGKPYFSIKYTEDGQDFIGYGTYNPDVLSEYLKEYFMPSAQPEGKKGKWIRITQGAMPEQYICPFCHRTVEAYGVEELLSIRYPYSHCGADMRGEEND